MTRRRKPPATRQWHAAALAGRRENTHAAAARGFGRTLPCVWSRLPRSASRQPPAASCHCTASAPCHPPCSDQVTPQGLRVQPSHHQVPPQGLGGERHQRQPRRKSCQVVPQRLGRQVRGAFALRRGGRLQRSEHVVRDRDCRQRPRLRLRHVPLRSAAPALARSRVRAG